MAQATAASPQALLAAAKALIETYNARDWSRARASMTADFDYDGLVSETDLGVLHAHMGHADLSTRPTPVARTSWGRLRSLYRGAR